MYTVPAGVSLTTAGVDTLRQAVLKPWVNHTQTEWLLMHLTAGVPIGHINTQCVHTVHTVHLYSPINNNHGIKPQSNMTLASKNTTAFQSKHLDQNNALKQNNKMAASAIPY